MPDFNPLSVGIRSALMQSTAHPKRVEASAELLAEDAHDAQQCVEVVMATISEIVQAPYAERQFLALQLLRASCDHGRALLYLLANNPLDMAGSALALHRAQIESFLRAVFYSHIANDDELQNFFDSDLGPARRTAKNKWDKISVPALAVEVDECLNRIENAEGGAGKVATMVANAWSPLCGMVHGGRAIHALYADGQRQIGCDVPDEVIFEITVNVVAFVNFALVFSSEIGGQSGPEDNEALGKPMARFRQFVTQHNLRLRSVGLADMERHIDW